MKKLLLLLVVLFAATNARAQTEIKGYVRFVPTVRPTSPLLGTTYFDQSTNLYYVYDTNGWTAVGSGSATDATVTFTDITTNNSSTSKHGFLKKLDNNSAHFMDGTGAWSSPSGSDACTASNCSVTNLLLPASPTTSTTGILYKGTATAAHRFIHNFWDQNGSSDGDLNTFVGLGSGNFTMAYVDPQHSADRNTTLGTSTLAACTDCSSNVMIGAEAGKALTVGYQNVIIGDKAGQFLTGGEGNTIIGKDALFTATGTLNDNTGVGVGVLQALTSGTNTAIGNHAAHALTTGSANTAIGNLAMAGNRTGDGNTALGENTMGANSANLNPAAGTAIGFQALANVNSTSFLMTALGYDGCFDCAGDTDSIYIGYFATRSGGDHTNVINIANTHNSINCDNCTTIGNAATTDAFVQGNLKSTSVRGTAVTFANRPGTPVEGMMVAFTDSTTATWGATITGTGSNHVLGYYNGTNWTVAAK